MGNRFDVFVLKDKEGRLLDPAIQANVLAKYSRSAESAREMLKNISKEMADKFADKWVVNFGHNCYDDKTEVLTEDGFVLWSDLKEGVKLATLNPDTNCLEYYLPSNIIRKKYSGKMYKVKGNKVNLVVTPNHKMWVWLKGNNKQRSNPKYELIEASEIYRRPVAYQRNCDWVGESLNIKYIYIGENKVPANAAFSFIGFFIGDGYYDKRCKSSVIFRLRKKRKIKYLKSLCDELGFEYVEHKGDKYYIKFKNIGEWVSKCYTDNGSKQIPKWALKSNKELINSLFEGLIQSDGHTYKNGCITYSTTSEILKEQFYELCLKVGYSVSIRKTISKIYENAVPLFNININRCRNRPEINKVKRQKHDCWIDYDGMIYCAEMPKNHILYVRRNGRCIWSGNSVAELGVVPVCFEGISIVASKFIERWQRAGYSEKSTRYQEFSRDSFILPPNAPTVMQEFANGLYDAYDELLPKMIKICKSKMPPGTKKKIIKARAFDNIRYLLPAGTGTNVACVLNIRDARDMIVALRSYRNTEFNLLGDKLHDVLEEMVPTLVRHTEPNKFTFEVKRLNDQVLFKDKPYVQILVDGSDLNYSNFYGDNNYLERFKNRVGLWYDMDWLEFCKKMNNRPEHSQVPDIFKTIKVTFELMMDYGAFRDLQRHRRCEQYVEPLTTEYGYVIPDDIIGTELEGRYQEAMESIYYLDILASEEDTDLLQNDIDLKQYMIPLGFLHRSYFQMDLKELYYIVELRTRPHGHISYRRIVYQMYEKALEYWPDLMCWCRAVKPDEIGLHE